MTWKNYIASIPIYATIRSRSPIYRVPEKNPKTHRNIKKSEQTRNWFDLFLFAQTQKKILTEISPNFEMISTPATLTRVPTLFLPVTIFRSSVKAKESWHQPEWELERARARARRLRLTIWLTINYISIRALGLIFTKARSLPFCERSKASLPRSLKLHLRRV